MNWLLAIAALAVPLVLLVVTTHHSPGPAAAALGFLMPLTSVPGVHYAYIVAARLLLTLLIAARWSADTPSAVTPYVRQILIPIGVLGALVGGLAVMRSDHTGISTAESMIESAIVASILARRSRILPGLAAGFVIGASASAIVALLQGSSGVGGGGGIVSRYIGLSSSSTRVSYEYAIALLIIVFVKPRSGLVLSLPRICVAGLLSVALALSGGRGGLLALGVGLLVVSTSASPVARRARAVTLAFGGIVFGAVASGVKVPVLDRIVGSAGTSGGASVGFSNGRSGLLSDAFGIISSHPFTGFGIDQFTTKFGVEPHAAVMFFGVAAGWVGFAIALALVLRVWMAALIPRRTDRASALAIGILAVLAVRSVLEPTSPLVGVEEVSLVAVGFRLLYEHQLLDAEAPA